MVETIVKILLII